jgi:hypothetical protein
MVEHQYFPSFTEDRLIYDAYERLGFNVEETVLP